MLPYDLTADVTTVPQRYILYGYIVHIIVIFYGYLTVRKWPVGVGGQLSPPSPPGALRRQRAARSGSDAAALLLRLNSGADAGCCGVAADLPPSPADTTAEMQRAGGGAGG